MRKLLYLFLLVLLSCSAPGPKTDNSVLTQINSFELLMQGNYQGIMPYSAVLEYGDFGIGSFTDLNGEMVLLDGKVYRVEADGHISIPSLTESACIATLCYFSENKSIMPSQSLGLEELYQLIQSQLADENLFYAIKIEGSFSELITRSVYAQHLPYRPLLEVLEDEVVHERKDIGGTMIGFLAPKHIKGAVWEGFHFHFISDDLKQGGHVKDVVTEEITIEIQALTQFNLLLSNAE